MVANSPILILLLKSKKVIFRVFYKTTISGTGVGAPGAGAERNIFVSTTSDQNVFSKKYQPEKGSTS
jgi:hypothetical protein